jgi:hypothetical protein
MEYNSSRPILILKEYGRNIQKLIEHALTIDDKAERQKVVNQIIHIMGNLNPHLKNVEDFNHLLWDHLHIMSDFKLDVDSPYPVPEKETLYAKPQKFDYPQKNERFRHYGKNIMSMIDKAIAMEDEEKKQLFAECIANYMKIVHNNWNRENVTDEIILNDLQTLSGGKLSLGDETTLNKVKNVRKTDNNRNQRNNGGGGKRFPQKHKKFSHNKPRN